MLYLYKIEIVVIVMKLRDNNKILLLFELMIALILFGVFTIEVSAEVSIEKIKNFGYNCFLILYHITWGGGGGEGGHLQDETGPGTREASKNQWG